MKHTKYDKSGFTLVEIAIVLLIGGLFLVSVSRIYGLYMKQYLYKTNEYRLQQTHDALLTYRSGAGRFPCPADPRLAPGDVGYGEEVCPSAGGCPTGLKCVNGRDVDGDGIPERVLIGAVPHNTILDFFANGGVFAENVRFPDFGAFSVIDVYGTKLSYAVTEELSNPGYSFLNPAPSNLGAISITDEFNKSIITPPESGQVVVFSHGENRVGGYDKNGTFHTDCIISSFYTGSDPGYVAGGVIPPGINSSSIQRDKENCDDNDAIFIVGSRSMAPGAHYYDDSLYYINATSQELWKPSFLSNGMAWYNTNSGNVGIGVDAPRFDAKLHVGDKSGSHEADMHAPYVRAQKYCDSTGDDCMDPETIAGNLPQMTCPNQYEAVVAIENNHVICEPVIVSVPTSACPNGEFLVGVSNLGHIKCAPPPGGASPANP